MKKQYLSLRNQGDALALMKNAFPPPGRSITIPLLESEGRVVADPIYAPYAVPDATIAETDGIAVKSSNTAGAGEQRPVVLSDFVRVDTGDVIPPEYDAVISFEEIQPKETFCIARKAARLGQGIRSVGQDIRRGDLIIPRGHQIRSSDISALASYGYDRVPVRAVRVGIIPVGNELVPIGTLPEPGQFVESNSVFAASFLSRLGALWTRYAIVPDDPLEIENSLEKAISENDLVLISSGTSTGRYDYTAESITRLGMLLFHGIAMLPGKPAMAGEVGGKPVIGLPGYPVGSQTVLRELVAPLLIYWGLAPVPEWIIPGRLAKNMPSELGFDEYIPVSVGSVNGCAWAFPHPRGSGLQMNLVRANGYLHIPPHSEGWEAGAWAHIHCTSLPHLIERTLLCVGAKTPGIALLANTLADNAISMHTFAVMPARALLYLQNNSCNIVTLSTPQINLLPEMNQGLRNLPSVSIHIGQMQIGIVSRDGIRIEDLANTSLINAPRGSTGRMLLDKFLSAGDLRPDQIRGDFRNMKKTEHAVVAAVANGIADAGICSFALAADSGLSFTPVTLESHDILIRRESLDDERVRTLMHVMQSPEFTHMLQTKGRYVTTRTGQIKDFLHEPIGDTFSGEKKIWTSETEES
ncbi:MAG: molybdopterin-binding protein [Methanomicrobiaceae archaeon]|nr:molybdopterin-binding protein [Methanomicrobiaceae archaeon]